MQLGFLISPAIQFVDVSGRPLVGGYVVVYLHGTTIPYITFKDGFGNKNAAKIILDAKGMCTIIADNSKAYDIYCYSRNGVQQWSRSNVEVGNDILIVDGDNSYVKETALVVVTPSIRAEGGLSLTSTGAANVVEQVGLNFEIAHLELKQEPWNSTEERVGLSFEIPYLDLYTTYEAMIDENGEEITDENNSSIYLLVK